MPFFWLIKKYLHKDVADPNDPHTFILHSVLVHSGDVHGGHYYAFVRPYSADGQFFKFDDERVTKASEEQAITDNFGGDDELPQHFYKTPGRNLHKRFSNAYMLVYVREKEMARLREIFLAGAKERGYDLKRAAEIYDLMAEFAKYGFNKSTCCLVRYS